MNTMPLRTRIAPTPSGYLHIGNLFSFIKTWLVARHFGGSLLLRIDDLDADRAKPEYLDDIFRTLEFIGLQPDEGPSGPEAFLSRYSQRYRLDHYRQLLQQLVQTGTVYACNCSRKKIQQECQEGIYPGWCRMQNKPLEGGQIAWRFSLPENDICAIEDALTGKYQTVTLHRDMGDFIVRRKDGIAAYQIASLADDIFYRINYIVRGEDLFSSTAAQLCLAKILGLSNFQAVKWHHHKLIKDPNQKKLSKSAGDCSIRWLRQQGMNRHQILSMVTVFLTQRELRLSNLSELLEHAGELLFS